MFNVLLHVFFFICTLSSANTDCDFVGKKYFTIPRSGDVKYDLAFFPQRPVSTTGVSLVGFYFVSICLF